MSNFSQKDYKALLAKLGQEDKDNLCHLIAASGKAPVTRTTLYNKLRVGDEVTLRITYEYLEGKKQATQRNLSRITELKESLAI
jgi:hypothetical protein